MAARRSGALVDVVAPAARVVGVTIVGVSVFRGIPYAEPPVGELRFAPPQSPRDVADVDAREFGAISLQDLDPLPRLLPGTENNFYHLSAATDEDCLNLNIWSPAVTGSAPVLFWIHSGGFLCGSGTGAWTDGMHYARDHGIVVVTINYRLGVLGGLYLGDHDPSISNLALQDQIAALRWVHRNIASFGGDASKVTIAGQSVGAMSVGAILAAPGVQGRFARAIIESGHVSACVPLNSARETTSRALDALAVDRTGDVLAQPRSISTLPLLAIQRELGIAARMFPMVKDGLTLSRDPVAAVAGGSAAGIDLLIGTTHEEDRLFAVSGWALVEADIGVTLRALLPDGDAAAQGEVLYRDFEGSERDRQHPSRRTMAGRARPVNSRSVTPPQATASTTTSSRGAAPTWRAGSARPTSWTCPSRSGTSPHPASRTCSGRRLSRTPRRVSWVRT